MRKSHSLRSQAIKPRRVDVRVAVTTQSLPGVVIGEDQEYDAAETVPVSS